MHRSSHRWTPFRRLEGLATGALLLAASLPGNAATVCVDTDAELVVALTDAAGSAETDTIRIARGDYTLTQSLQLSVAGGLEIYGGIGACSGFTSISIDPSLTRIFAGDPQQTVMQLALNAGDYEIRSLSFIGFAGIEVEDAAAGNVVAGTLDVSNNRFEDGAKGLFLDLDTTDLRVENNLIANNVGAAAGGDYGLRIDHDTAGSAPLQIVIAHNTIVGQPQALQLRGGGPLNGDLRLHNNIFDAGSSAGTAVSLDAISVRSYDSLWLGQRVFSNGGAFALVEYSIEAASMLGPDFVPMAGSQAVNTGFDMSLLSIGGPASDIDGGRRIIGSAPDRGAFESAISDIPVLTVINTDNSGPGSLRQAILDSNVSSNPETIEFDIPGGCPQTIVLTSPLQDVISPLTIDGFTQPGSSPNQLQGGYDAVHCVQLGSAVAHGLRLEPAADQSMTVRGLLFFGFTQAAIEVEGAGKARIEGNRFGGLPGDPGLPNHGISVVDAPGTVIGGEGLDQVNLIGRAEGAGVYLGPGTLREVRNNLIGIDGDGYSDVGNGIGIHIVDGYGDTIALNYIGHSAAEGILAERPLLGKRVAPPGFNAKGGPETLTRFVNNNIGSSPRLNASQTRDAGNAGSGVRLGSGNRWELHNNRIAYNQGDGIEVLPAVQGATFTLNSVHDNGGLGIDLFPDGVDPQDPDDNASGANGTQNFPLLDSADGGVESGMLRGSLRSAPGIYTIELYYSDACDPSGHGEGRNSLDSSAFDITIPSPALAKQGFDQSVSFSAPIDGGALLQGTYITALARNSVGNTSEFSACIPYVVTEVFRDGFE